MADVEEALFAVVIWHDTHSESHWMDLEHLDQEPYEVKSAGWLIPDAKRDHVVLAQSIGSDEQADSVLCIPMGMVVKVTIVNRTDIR